MSPQTITLLNRLEACGDELERIQIELREMHAERDRARTSAAHLESELHQLTFALAGYTAELDRARDWIERLDAKYRAVITSTSWRVTAPARRLGQALHRR